MAVADVGVARANLYPRLSLSGAITMNATGKGGGADYFLGPVVQFPSFDQLANATLDDMIDAKQVVAEANTDLADLRRQSALQFIDLNTSLGAGSKANRPDG